MLAALEEFNPQSTCGVENRPSECATQSWLGSLIVREMPCFKKQKKVPLMASQQWLPKEAFRYCFLEPVPSDMEKSPCMCGPVKDIRL